ncbi:MAG: alpha/beta hydrolase [Anaerolineae bacterium]
MNRLLAILTASLALLTAVPFLRPRSHAGQAFLWLPKLLGSTLSPVAGLVSALATLVGLASRRWTLAATGLLGAGLAARLIASLPDVDRELAALPGFGGKGPAPGAQGPPVPARLPGRTGGAGFQRDLVLGHNPVSGKVLRADLWPPSGPGPSGLGLIYAHGSGWRVGDKDMLTRPFFRRLVAQGHLVVDIAYTLWPAASLPAMVAEVNQAILWLKENGPTYGVDPDRIVLMGGSAGAHLALLAAYTPGHPGFWPAGTGGDTSVHGVVAFYPPVDLLELDEEARDALPPSPGSADRLAQGMLAHLFGAQDGRDGERWMDNLVAEMLGGTSAEIPDTYRLLSPIYHAGAHCPPTLLLQNSDDVFGLAPAVRRLHERLRAAGVPSVLLEFPHTEHGFDLLLPQISPTARAAARGVEQCLAWLG